MATDDDRPDMEPVPDMPGYYRRRTEYAHHRGGQRADGLTSVGAHLDRLDTPTVTRRALEAAGPDPALMRAVETITRCIDRVLDEEIEALIARAKAAAILRLAEVIRTGVIEGVTAASVDLGRERR